MNKNIDKKIDNLLKIAQLKKNQANLNEAISFLKEVLVIDENNKKALNNIANIYKEIGKYEEATKFYEKAISLDDNYLVAKTNLAILSHELGNLKKAERIYKELINQDKYNFSLYFNLSRINFDFFNFEIIEFIKNSLTSKNLSNFNKASAYFILAKKENLAKNFDKEIQLLEKGHYFFQKSMPSKIFEQNLSYWLNIIPKKFKKIKLSNSNIHLKKNELIKPIFIIGMPRSGSTLVESIISSGKIYIPNGGETAVINGSILKLSRDKILKLIQDDEDIIVDKKIISEDILKKYESLNLIKKEINYFFIDKSLENFFYIELLIKLFPNSKFIHCKRNIHDSILAIYQNFHTKMSWTHSLENIFQYFDNYLTIINFFEKQFSNKIYSVDLSELTNDSVNISKKIFDFCGLEWSKKSLEFHKRKDLFSNTASNIQIREKIYKYDQDKYKAYNKYLKNFGNKYAWFKKDI